MKKTMKIYNKPVFWIWFIIVFNCIYMAATHFLGLPGFIVYFSDLACVILGLALLKNKTNYLKDAKTVKYLLIFLFLETLLGYLFSLYNPLVYLWGFRTFFRFIIFFLACICYLRTDDVKKFMRFFNVILFVNAIFCIYEYANDYGLDSISGLYTAGINMRGGASGLNVLMCIVSTYALIRYIYKEISALNMAVPIALCMIMASLSEQKAFYFEFIIIVVLCTLLTKFSFKKLVAVVVGIGMVLAGFSLYGRYYGDRNNIFSLEEMLAYTGLDGSSYGSHSLNRATALPYVIDNILKTPIQKLFGLGLGYGDNVSNSFISSGFFGKYSHLGYQYFFTSLEGVNIGILGLILYYAVITSIFVYARKKGKKAPAELKKYYVLTQVTALLTFFLSAYNQSLILDIAAFNVYFVLSIPFIAEKEMTRQNRTQTAHNSCAVLH